MSSSIPVQSSRPFIEAYFENCWLPYAVLAFFWAVFYGKLLTGASWIFDDFAHQFFPTKSFMAISLSQGIIPYWNPYSFGGTPFFADPQIGVLYPLNTVLALFVSGGRLPPLCLQISIVFHALLMSVFTYLLGRHLKLSRCSALLMSVLFSYSSCMVIHLIHQALFEAVAWFPLIVLCWMLFVKTGNYLHLSLAVLSMALSILCGYPQVVFYNYLFIGSYVIAVISRKLWAKDWRGATRLVGGFSVFAILPLGLTALQLLPSREFASLSNRAAIDYSFAAQGSFSFPDFITLLMPKYFGVWNWNYASGDLPWWGQHQDGPWMFSVANLYLTVLPVVMLVPALRYSIRRTADRFMILFLSGFALMALLFSLGRHFFLQKLFFDYLPLFDRFRNPGHALYFCAFALSVITAVGIDALLEDRKSFSRYVNARYFAVLLGASALLLFMYLGGMFRSGALLSRDAVYQWVTRQCLIFSLLLFIYSALIYLRSKGYLPAPRFGLLLIAAVLADTCLTWHDHNNGSVNPELLLAQNARIAGALKEELRGELFRVSAREGNHMILQRNQGMIDRIPLMEGYGALLLERRLPFGKPGDNGKQVLDLMNVKYRTMVDRAAGTMTLARNDSYMPRVMMLFDAKVLPEEDRMREYMASPAFNGRQTVVIEKEPPGELPLVGSAAGGPRWHADIAGYDVNRLSVNVETSENGFLLLSEVYYPAWKCYVDGNQREIYRADNALRSVFIEKGTHRVEMRYESEMLRLGLRITLASWAVLLTGACIVTIRRARARNPILNTIA